jgi:hypothetical protein
MPGQHIWHIKVRRIGKVELERAEPQLDRGCGPVKDEVIKVVVKSESVRAKIATFNTSTSGSTSTYAIEAVEEDDGKRPGHREGGEDDF